MNLFFSTIYGTILPIDELIFFRGVAQPPTFSRGEWIIRQAESAIEVLPSSSSRKQKERPVAFFLPPKKTTWAHDQQDLSRVLFMWIKHE